MNNTIKFPNGKQQAYIPDMRIMVQDIDTVAKIYNWLAQRFSEEKEKTMTVFESNHIHNEAQSFATPAKEQEEKSEELTSAMNSEPPESFLPAITAIIHKYNCKGICLNAPLDLSSNRYFSVGCFLEKEEGKDFLMETHTRMESTQWVHKDDANKCEEKEVNLGVAFIEYIKSLGCKIVWFNDNL